jgi:hypothetical protein
MDISAMTIVTGTLTPAEPLPMPESVVADDHAKCIEDAQRAAAAWRDLSGEQLEPTRVEVLTDVHKTSVYRLEGVGPDRAAVIAKRCLRSILAIERVVYEQLLPRLPLSTPQYYGSMEGKDDEYGWLFLEDMGGEPYSSGLTAHWTVAAEWLGTLHSTAFHAGVEDLLPDRGPDHFLECLRASRDRILHWLGNARAVDDIADVAAMRRIVSRCDVVESRWSEVVEMCARMPRTLVHGDFQGKNARIRSDGTNSRFLIVDWEMAGCGVPAVDLGGWGIPSRAMAVSTASAPSEPFLTAYLSAVRQIWPNLSAADVTQMATIGAVFRVLTATEWASVDLERSVYTSIPLYESRLSTLTEIFGWDH